MESRGRSHVKAQNGAVEGLWPVVADLHHLDEEQDSDPNPKQSVQSDPYQSENRDQDPDHSVSARNTVF